MQGGGIRESPRNTCPFSARFFPSGNFRSDSAEQIYAALKSTGEYQANVE
jgi:hypothetical protein